MSKTKVSISIKIPKAQQPQAIIPTERRYGAFTRIEDEPIPKQGQSVVVQLLGATGLEVIGVSSASSPKVVSRLSTLDLGSFPALTTFKKKAYCFSGNTGSANNLTVVNFSNPLAPSKSATVNSLAAAGLRSFPGGGSAHNPCDAQSDGSLCLVTHGADTLSTFEIWDVSGANPSPIRVYNIRTDFGQDNGPFPTGGILIGSIYWVVGKASTSAPLVSAYRLCAYDVSNPSAVTQLSKTDMTQTGGFFGSGNGAMPIGAIGNVGYFEVTGLTNDPADGSPNPIAAIQAWNLANPSAPVKIGSLNLNINPPPLAVNVFRWSNIDQKLKIVWVARSDTDDTRDFLEIDLTTMAVIGRTPMNPSTALQLQTDSKKIYVRDTGFTLPANTQFDSAFTVYNGSNPSAVSVAGRLLGESNVFLPMRFIAK